MRQPTGSPCLYTLFSVQFFGLPGPKKYAMSPRRIRLPDFFSCAATCSDARASPDTTMAADNAMVTVLRIADSPPPESLPEFSRIGAEAAIRTPIALRPPGYGYCAGYAGLTFS